MAQAYVPTGGQIKGAAQFFDHLNDARIAEPLRARIRDTLTVLLEDDGETVPPDVSSFSAFVSFLARHGDLVAPTFGVNREGVVVARWRQPGFQLSYEFEPAGRVHWLLTEVSGGAPYVRDGWDSPDRAPLPPRQQRAFA